MGEIKIPGNFLQLIIAVVLTATVISVCWLYFYNQEQHLHMMTISLNEKQIASLEEQLDRQSVLNNELINNLAGTQEARVLAETQLAEITAQLMATEEKYNSLDDMNWESKYKFAMLDNESLVAKIAELEFGHEEIIDAFENSEEELLSVKSYIEEDFINLEFKYDVLLDEDAYLKEQYISDVQQFAKESETLRNDLNKKEKELKKQQQLVSKLQEENINYKNTLAQKKKEIVSGKEEVQNITATASNKKTDYDNSENFRTARIRSLSSAMLNRNSIERKNILVSVIPNIPNGVSGNELSSLVQGMESADILSVIQSTTPHINRPLANEAFDLLTKNMNKQEAALASNLLGGD